MGTTNVPAMAAVASRLEKILLNNMPNEYRSYFNKTFTPAKTSSSKSKKSGKTSPREGEVCLSVCLSVGISFVVEIVLVVPIDCPYEHEESEGTTTKREKLPRMTLLPRRESASSSPRMDRSCPFGDSCIYSHEKAGKVASVQVPDLKH
eukprot:TRINITY_DN1475_c0_g1_i13.p1 TRINITY_DN1475_c0_g1~~TRINITY_DN1475_c0_g1_i13.p1  ORF type:complete len:149 (-),score=26.25 TRINITY_DN1475_c0_g1_i13:275-721(-)